MKSIYKVLPLAVIGTLAITASCSKKATEVEAQKEFTTDSVAFTDSLRQGGNFAKVTITGMYPADGPKALVDSVRTWIAGNVDSKADMADGNALIAQQGKQLIDTAKTYFESSKLNDMQFEFVYSFKPVYSTDSVLTYNFSSYAFMGGAHGMSINNNQTFVSNTGAALTTDDIIAPAATDSVASLVRQSLWQQYFQPKAADWNNEMSAMLLVNPDSLRLPALPPYFTAEGVAFTYQQYEIAPYALGQPTCTIAYDAIAKYLTPEAARLAGIPAAK